MSFQLCIPAQQISPSAANRSPWSAAILAASLKVDTILAVLVLESSLHFSTPNSAESIRITPPLRAPCSLKTLAIRQAILTASRNFPFCSSVPMAESPTVPGQTGATKEPISKPLLTIRSAIDFSSSSLASGLV